MPEDQDSFTLQIARELGSIDSRLKSIEDLISKQDERFESLGKLGLENKAGIAGLKTKLTIMVLIVSGAINVSPKVFTMLFGV